MIQNEKQTIHTWILVLSGIVWGMLMGYATGGWISRFWTDGQVTVGKVSGAVVGGLMSGGMILAAINRVAGRPQTMAWKITLLLLGGVLVGGGWGLIGGGLATLIAIGNLVSVPGVILIITGSLGILSAIRQLVRK